MAIFTAIGVAIAGALFGGSVLAATLISAALAFGVQLAVSYLTRPKARTYGANQGEKQFGARVPVGTFYGTGKGKGHAIYYAKWGSGNKYNADVIVLANGWCDGLEPYIYFYGKKHDLTTRTIIDNEVAHYAVDGFGDLISIRFYDGRPGQGVDTKLVSDTASVGMEWKSTSVCAGLCYVVVERIFDQDKFSNGHPDFEFVLRGLRLYDPRLDDTVDGGEGDHRLNDPATWEFSRNPALQRLNYQLGLRGLISDRTLIGEGKSLGQLDLGSYFTALNVCDTVREGKATYEASLYVTADDDHTEILKEFDDAMAGYGMNRRGLSGVIAGAPQIPVYDIGPDDIDAGRSKQIRRRKSAFDLYNHISGQFTSPEANWNPESLTPVVVNQDVTDDGRVRQTSNDFLQVTDPDIAQYLLQIRYRQNRKGGSATVPVSRRCGFQVTEGEWVTYADATWLVTGWSCDEDLQFTLTLAETGSDVYSSDDIEPGPVILPPPVPVNPSLLSTVQDFTVEVGLEVGEEGFEVPALRFTWTPPEDPTITAVRIFYGQVGGPQIFEVQCSTPEDGEFITTANVVSGVFYQARATITTVPSRFVSYTGWFTTISATGRTKVSVQLDGMSPGFLALLSGMIGSLNEVEARMEQIALNGSEVAGSVSNESSVSRRFRDAIAVALTGQKATITETGGALKAFSEAFTAVSAQVGESGAEGLFQITAEATPGDAEARIGLTLRAEANGVEKIAAMFMDALASGKARIGFAADQIGFIVDGDLVGVFDEDGLKLNNALIANLDATNITADKLDAAEILQDGTLITDLFAFNAVTEYGDLGFVSNNPKSGVSAGSFPETVMATVTIDNPAGNPTLNIFNLRLQNTLSGSGNLNSQIKVKRNGVTLHTVTNNASNATQSLDVTSFINDGDTDAVYQITLAFNWNVGGGSNCNCIVNCTSGVLFWKT